MLFKFGFVEYFCKYNEFSLEICVMVEFEVKKVLDDFYVCVCVLFLLKRMEFDLLVKVFVEYEIFDYDEVVKVFCGEKFMDCIVVFVGFMMV